MQHLSVMFITVSCSADFVDIRQCVVWWCCVPRLEQQNDVNIWHTHTFTQLSRLKLRDTILISTPYLPSMPFPCCPCPVLPSLFYSTIPCLPFPALSDPDLTCPILSLTLFNPTLPCPIEYSLYQFNPTLPSPVLPFLVQPSPALPCSPIPCPTLPCLPLSYPAPITSLACPTDGHSLGFMLWVVTDACKNTTLTHTKASLVYLNKRLETIK